MWFPRNSHLLSLLSLQRWRSHLGNKRYLATGWSRGRFGNLEFMEEEWNVERLQYGKKIREKERRAQLYHFFSDSRSSTFFGSCEACRKHQSLTSSMQPYFGQLIHQTNCKQLFQSTKMTSKKLKKMQEYSLHFLLNLPNAATHSVSEK